MSREPMTETQARENVAAMKAETPRNAMRRVLQLALERPYANLSDDARRVYSDALAEPPAARSEGAQ